MDYSRALHKVLTSDNMSDIDLSELSLTNEKGYTVAHTAVRVGLTIEPNHPALELKGGHEQITVRELLHRHSPQTILTHK